MYQSHASNTLTETPSSHGAETRVRRVGAVMAFIASTLAVASALHLSGNVHGRSQPFDASHAGIAEALIAAVLAGGAVAMLRPPDRARPVGLLTVGFAIVGFLVGLSMTVRGGNAPDIAYHVTLLPVLVAGFVTLLRTPAGRR